MGEYDTPDELTEERERRRYGGMTRGEVKRALRRINDLVFEICSSGDVREVYEEVKDDDGLLTYLDEIARTRIGLENREFLSEGVYFMQERVREMLFKEGRMPQQIFDRGPLF